MTKKFFMGLIPLLAVAAFVVMPAVAQAEPHYYKNGSATPLAEGEIVPIIGWGKLTLSPEPPILAVTTCEFALLGYVDNPVGGGAGLGGIRRLTSANCINAECPPGSVNLAGNGVGASEGPYEKEFQVNADLIFFPWLTVLTELEPGGKIRDNITSPSSVFPPGVGPGTTPLLTLGCYAAGYPRSPRYNENGEIESLPLAPSVVVEASPHVIPVFENGTNAGPNQSKLAFDSPKSIVGANAFMGRKGEPFEGNYMKIKESIKIMGYKASEVITVH